MASDSGTVILQDDGAVTLDEDGAELVSAGDSDCDCCHVEPICCTVGGCTFDLANGRMQGHISITRTYHNSLDGSGAVVHTFVFESDFDLQMHEDACVATPLYLVGGYNITPDTNPDGSPILSHMTATWDGADVDPQFISGIEIQVDGGSLGGWDGSQWWLTFHLDIDSGMLDTMIAPLMDATNDDTWGINGGDDFAANGYDGDCAGIPTATRDTMQVSFANTYSTNTHGTLEMDVVGNYCV